MTLVTIDLQNAGYETGPDDRVVFYSPANRNEQGVIISTAETSVPLVDGQAEKELAPGPVVVQILAQGVADTRQKSGYVPDEGPVSLWDVVLDWSPALLDQGILAILAALDGALGQVEGAVAAEVESIRWKRPPLTAESNIDELPDGDHPVTQSVAGALGLPQAWSGGLVSRTVIPGTVGGVRTQELTLTNAGVAHDYVRTYWNGSWSAWNMTSSSTWPTLITDGDAATLADAKSYADNLVTGSVPALGTTDLDTITDTRNYRQTSSSNVTPDLHYPPVSSAYKGGTLLVASSGGGSATQLYIADRAGEVYVRERYAGTWREWQKIGRPVATVPSLGTTDLDTLTDSETYRQTSSNNITEDLNYPPVSGQFKAGTLTVTSSGGGSATQVYIADQAGEMWTRASVAGTWRGWVQIGAGGEDSPAPDPTDEIPTDGIPTLEMEVTGKWTPTEKGDAFLLALAEKHDQVQALEIGRSVQDRPIYAAIIGDPTLPAVLVTAGLHGTEVGPPESAWLWVKEMAQSKSLILMDMCIIVVPCVQPDNRFVARGNKNVVDINRDWVDISQPETQAVNSLFLNYNIIAMMDSHNFGYPRHVSLLPANLGKPEVNALSQELYDVVFAAFEAEGELVRNYAPGLDERSLVQGSAILYDVASLLIEIPCGGYGTWTFDDYYPPPSWQAHVGSIAYTTFAHYVWRNLPAFLALKAAV